jgi:adenylate cyclase
VVPVADVFVSYARSGEPVAKQVCEELRKGGYSVWRDDELPAHRSYADVIEERLQSAKAVVVIWSAEAAKSQWVRAEADAARQAGTLIQVSADGTVPPIPFNQIQCADLRDWSGDADAPQWRKLLGSVAALTGGQASERPEQNARHSCETCICVLPFANMSGDAEQEYFSDGISEDITTDLSKVSALSVVARNTAFTFKGQAVNVTEVARKLGVSHVLEGSVRKAGNRIRITAQLIAGRTGDHVWAERYDRDLDDIFAIQDEISKAIVGALKLKLLPEEKKAIEQRGTTSAEAYNLYLMARQYWITGNHGDVRREERVMRVCKRAVEIDTHYAQAWALLAIAQSSLRYGFGRQVDDGVAAAHTALAIDPSIAEAHCPMVRRLWEKGQFAEALSQIEIALRLDPDSWEVNKEAARLFYAQRRIADAAKHFQRAVELMETDYHAWAMLASCLGSMGDREGMLHAAKMMVSQSERVLAEDPSNGAALGIVAAGLTTLGERERAREWIDRALLIDPDNLNMRYNIACTTALQDPEGTLDMLEPLFARMSGSLFTTALVDPDFDSIRDHPRFQKMLAEAKERLGFKEETATGDEAGQTVIISPAASAEPSRS